MTTLFFILLVLAITNFLIQGVLVPLCRERIIFQLEDVKDKILQVGKENNISDKEIHFATNLIDEGITFLPHLTVSKLFASETNAENPIENLNPFIKDILNTAVEKIFAGLIVNHLFLCTLLSPMIAFIFVYFFVANRFKHIKNQILSIIHQNGIQQDVQVALG